MNVSREDKKREAIERMKQIGIYPDTIKQFEEDDRVSESLPPYGACYWIDDDTAEHVKEFETEHDALVYHIIHAKYVFEGGEIMEMYTYMFICDTRSEWSLDREDLESEQAFCYIYNATAPDMSEFGSIGFEVGPAGGLLRTY